MKIQPFNYNVQFGYNKELNDKVNNKLKNAKKNKDLANHLLEVNQLCIKTEDLLRNAEKENNTKAMELYGNTLLSLKPNLAEELNKHFPALKYQKIERETYEKELEERNIQHDESHWLNAIVDDLRDFDDWFLEFSSPFGSVTNLEETAGKPVCKTKTDTCPDYLEEFVPNQLTPKGLESLGGMGQVKELLRDKILYPIENPEMAKLDEIEYGKKYPRGTMFYGPPGCGKTTSIEALVMEAKLPMFKLKISKAGSKYINESSSNIQQSYEYVCDIAEKTGKPVFLVIDEFESIAPTRDGDRSTEDIKMVGTLLQIIEEARSKNVIILGATNKFDMIDEAIRSRFDDKVYIGLPDAETRADVLKIHLNKRTKGQSLANNTKELAKVVELTKGFSNRDIAILTDKASLIARKDNRRDIIAEDYLIPVQENQNMKFKEKQFKDKQTRPRIGFNAR